MQFIETKLKNLPKGKNSFSMNFNTYYNRKPSVGERNDQPSKTVPDQALSVREIINRTQKGLPVTGVRVPMYNETDDGIMPDLRNMDISEIYELKQRIKKTEAEIKRQLQEAEEKRQQEETEEFYKKKFASKPKPEVVTDAEEVK